MHCNDIMQNGRAQTDRKKKDANKKKKLNSMLMNWKYPSANPCATVSNLLFCKEESLQHNNMLVCEFINFGP